MGLRRRLALEFGHSDEAVAYRTLRRIGGLASPTRIAAAAGWTKPVGVVVSHDVRCGENVNVLTGFVKPDRDRALAAMRSLRATGDVEAVFPDDRG